MPVAHALDQQARLRIFDAGESLLELADRPLEFYDKAVAVRGPAERIAFLAVGLKWAVRKFEEALPGIEDPETRLLIQGMRDRHLRSIALISERRPPA